jgi:EmrB/QacA subfamily drug resistance transporter
MPGTTEDMSITQGSIGVNVPGRCRGEVLVDGEPPAALGDPSRLGRRLRAVLAVVIIADILDLMDTTITNIAAPTIVRDIGGGESLIKWLGASYALALGVLLVVGGRLGDRYGQRRVFLIGIAGFTLASLGCGLSVDPTMLIACRLVQGGFGALLIPQGLSIMVASLSREQLPTVFSVFGPVMAGAALAGPIVAGFVISANIAGLSWRPIFLINIVLGTFGFLAALRVLPSVPPSSSAPIDGLGAGLLGGGMLGLLYGLIEGSTDGWTLVPILSMAFGVLLFGGFFLRQRSEANPLIKPSLFKNRGFTSGLILGLAYIAGINGLFYVCSLFLQTALGLSPSHAALGLAPAMVGIMASSFVGRPLIPVLGRRLVFIGLIATLVGIVALWVTITAQGTDVSVWLLAPSFLVMGAGMGTCLFSIFDFAIGDVAQDEAGSASGSLSAVQQLATAIGSALVTTIYFTQRTAHGAGSAMTTSLAVVGSITVLCLGLVWLLPKKAAEEPQGAER